MLTAVARDQGVKVASDVVAGISERFSKFAIVFVFHRFDFSETSEIVGKQNSLFLSGPVMK